MLHDRHWWRTKVGRDWLDIYWHWHVSEQTRFKRICRVLMERSLLVSSLLFSSLLCSSLLSLCIFYNSRTMDRGLPSVKVSTGVAPMDRIKATGVKNKKNNKPQGRRNWHSFFFVENMFLLTQVEWHFGSPLSKECGAYTTGETKDRWAVLVIVV